MAKTIRESENKLPDAEARGMYWSLASLLSGQEYTTFMKTLPTLIAFLHQEEFKVLSAQFQKVLDDMKAGKFEKAEELFHELGNDFE